MRKKYIHFEKVPVEVAEKILEHQNTSAKCDGNRKLVVTKLGKGRSGPHTLPRKVEVLVP